MTLPILLYHLYILCHFSSHFTIHSTAFHIRARHCIEAGPRQLYLRRRGHASRCGGFAGGTVPTRTWTSAAREVKVRRIRGRRRPRTSDAHPSFRPPTPAASRGSTASLEDCAPGGASTTAKLHHNDQRARRTGGPSSSRGSTAPMIAART